MKTIKIIFRVSFGLLFCLLSIVGFTSGGLFLAFIFLAIGLFILKPEIKELFNFSTDTKSHTISQTNNSSKELSKSISTNIKINVGTTNSNNPIKDESIIDVTGEPYKINYYSGNIGLKKYEKGVPYWAHKYIYSFKEITGATTDQVGFYNEFKKTFLQDQYYDLEGNNNYAFILLFELLLEYDHNKDANKLKESLTALGSHYPKTKYYAESFFNEKVGQGNNSVFQNRDSQDTYSPYFDNYKLGNKYKTKLNLNDEEVKIANRIWDTSNNFCSIEFCCIEIIKLYLAAIAELKNIYITEGTSLEEQFEVVTDVIARKQFRYKKGSQNYKYCVDSTTNDIYSNIFKHCENAVRDYYGHKRKVNTDSSFTAPAVKAEFETRISIKLLEILPKIINKVSPPDSATNTELYSQNTSRWKIKFDELTAKYNENPKQFFEEILILGNLNLRNPSIENIFYEASKFIAKSDKEVALRLYIYYLYYDLKSTSFDNKQLTKTIQKSLFKTEEQLHDFQKIVTELIKDRNLEKALDKVPEVYAVKRKKIKLDTASIKEVQQQHSGTVELLNEYLKDDEDILAITTQDINSEEVRFEIIQKTEINYSSIYKSEISFKPIHAETLEFFSRNNLSILQIDIEAFTKSKGVFKNQLIESINEACYEYLDDVLIEEEDEYYTINPNYYNRILAQ